MQPQTNARWSKSLRAVIWPAFLAACALELVVFAVVDPLDLSWGGGPLGWSRQAVYTVAFFVFWAACSLSSLTALAMLQTPSVPAPLD